MQNSDEFGSVSSELDRQPPSDGEAAGGSTERTRLVRNSRSGRPCCNVYAFLYVKFYIFFPLSVSLISYGIYSVVIRRAIMHVRAGIRFKPRDQVPE